MTTVGLQANWRLVALLVLVQCVLLVGTLTDFFGAAIAINAIALLTVCSGFVVAMRLRESRATTATRLLVVQGTFGG